MRYLHAVGAGETFVARGTYRRTDQAIEQFWTWHALGDNARFIRIDHDERATSGMSLLADVLLNTNGRVERINVQVWQAHPTAPYRQLRLEYVFLDGYVQVMRKVNVSQHEHHEITLPDNGIYVVCLTDFYLFWGELLQAGHDAQMPAFVPLWQHEGAVGQVVAGALPVIATKAQVALQHDGQAVQATHYRLIGGDEVWVNERGVPLRLYHAHARSDSILVNDAHR